MLCSFDFATVAIGCGRKTNAGLAFGVKREGDLGNEIGKVRGRATRRIEKRTERGGGGGGGGLTVLFYNGRSFCPLQDFPIFNRALEFL